MTMNPFHFRRCHTVIFLVCALMLTAIPSIGRAQDITITDVPAADFQAQFHQDLAMLKSFTENIGATVREMEASGLFRKDRTRDFDIDEKNRLCLLWANYLDHIIAFDRLMNFYRSFHLIMDRRNHEDAFLIAYAAALGRHANSLRIIRLTIDNDLYEKILDDAAPDYGIPAGMYARLKWNTLHVQDMTGVYAGRQYLRFLGPSFRKQGLTDSREAGWVFGAIRRNYEFITTEMKQAGARHFAANGLDVVKEKGFTAWFPLQMHVSEWMGDTKVKRKNSTLIAQEQLDVMRKQLRPGDIIVERRDWYLSNVGLPGFWPHAELYVGTFEEMKSFFTDPEVAAHYRKKAKAGDFMDYLEKKYPARMKEFRKTAPDGYPHRIIEAVSEGVKFSSLEEGALADYIGVVRPRLSKLDIAKAVDEAFRYLGRPYDFNFDFITDSSIVCSELIYKIYKSGRDRKGLSFALREIAGRKAMPANDIVAKFDREFGSRSRELDFVYFLDGVERDKTAVSRSAEDLRASHRRMKWDIAQK